MGREKGMEKVGEREGKMSDSFIKMKLHIISREDACICTYTLDLELFDLILNKGEEGKEGDGELRSSSDAAMHLLRPVLGTLLLCSIVDLCTTQLAVSSRHISLDSPYHPPHSW